MMGKDPCSFIDRITLARDASASGDLVGAVIEYQAALLIKNDPAQREKLNAALKTLHDAEHDQFALTLFSPKDSETALARKMLEQR